MKSYKTGHALEDIEELKRELFMNLAVALKLNSALQGNNCSLSASALYDEMIEEGVPSMQWNQWIFGRLQQNARE